MEIFLRIDINIMAMILLGTVLFISVRSLDPEDELNRLFKRVSIVILVELFFETTTCILNRMQGDFVAPLSYFLHVCLFSVAPLLSYNWYRFICRWIHSRDITLPKNTALLIPLAVNFVITILSPLYGIVFYLDDANRYFRGEWFPLATAITYFYILLAVFSVLRKRKTIVKEEFRPLLLFGFLPLIGAMLQYVFYGALLMWSTCAFSLVIVYNFLQQRMVHIDNVTGVWTRSSFQYYLGQRVGQKNDRGFALLFFDLDGLKRINDTYGHMEGDFALKKTAEITKSCLRKTDVMARYGGDEFIILLDGMKKKDLSEVVKRLLAAFESYNEVSGKAYELAFSYGADVYDPVVHEEMDQFIRSLDEMMYKNKKAKELSLAFRRSTPMS